MMFSTRPRDPTSPPPVSTLRPPRFRAPTKPPSQQTPPSAQRPPDSQNPTVIPSSVPWRRSPSFDQASNFDPVQDDFNSGTGSVTPRASQDKSSQNAFEVLNSSQAPRRRPRRPTPNTPKWSDQEDQVLFEGIRRGWPAFEIARRLEGKTKVQRTEAAIRGRKKALVEKYDLTKTPLKSSSRVRMERRQKWTPAEMTSLQNGMRQGLDADALHQQRFAYRSLRSVKHKFERRKKVWQCQSQSVPSSQLSGRSTEQPTPGAEQQAVESNEPENVHSEDVIMSNGGIEHQDEVDEFAVPPDDRDETRNEELDNEEDVDLSKLRTAFVELPARPPRPATARFESPSKPGRLRRPAAAKTYQNRHKKDGHRGSVDKQQQPERSVKHEDQAPPAATVFQGGAIKKEPPVDAAKHDRHAAQDVPFSSLSTEEKQRRAREDFYWDWTPEQRWQDSLRRAGGDERLAKRNFVDIDLTSRMFSAVLRDDGDAVSSIAAERKTAELRWAIEDGRARRKPSAPEPIDGDVDDQVLRLEDWDVDSDGIDSMAELDGVYDDESDVDSEPDEEDMIRDREFVEIEEEDDQVEDLPTEPLLEHQTPIQAMRAVTMDDGLPTPVPTEEKLDTSSFRPKVPVSSVPATAPSEITTATTSKGSEASNLKRKRRRSRAAKRGANTRRQSERAQSEAQKIKANGTTQQASPTTTEQVKSSQARSSKVKSSEVKPSKAKPLPAEEDEFMKTIKNAHIPTPPRRRTSPPRRRGTPSPPAWFKRNEYASDSSDGEESD